MAQPCTVGKLAEELACRYLERGGYVVRERNWRISNTIEIDIIAQMGDVIVFCEVKARDKSGGDPVEAVDSRKRIKMVKAADVYLNMLDGYYDYRFDIFSIVYDGNFQNPEIEHIPDAFMPEANNGY